MARLLSRLRDRWRAWCDRQADALVNLHDAQLKRRFPDADRPEQAEAAAAWKAQLFRDRLREAQRGPGERR